MKIFTLDRGVEKGAVISTLTLKNGTKVPVLKVGEEGRGRSIGLINVQLNKENMKKFENGETVTIYDATLGETKTNRPKLIEVYGTECSTDAIVVLKTPIGFRGSNRHTGDLDSFNDIEEGFKDFPCNVLARGEIAQGDAGRMGSGYQYIALAPINNVFRTAYSGRLYGAPSSHYYMFDGDTILCQTWEEREASDFLLF